MTNLLQPADVAWFSVIKKAYREKWNHWFTYGDKEYTRNANMKSPGYVLCSTWISEIWQELSVGLIKKSFEVCGVHNNHVIMNYNFSIRMDNLHSTLREILVEGRLLQNTIDTDIDLAEADMNMNNHNEDVFERGSGEEEIEFGVADDQLEEEEEDAVRNMESNHESDNLPSQHEIETNLHREFNELPVESPEHERAENVSSPTYYQLAEPVQPVVTTSVVTVQNQPAEVSGTPVVRVRRTRRTKVQMAAYRVCL